MEFSRWLQLMSALKLSDNEDTFRALVAAYSEKHRAYHTTKHIDAVLALLDDASGLTDSPSKIELALWFHDAIYNPYSSSNEVDSAKWAETFLKKNNVPHDLVAIVSDLVLATLHNAAPANQGESLIIDIDLAILGADKNTFDRFEEGIRCEFRRVPLLLYRKKRKKILRGFLQRSRIYTNEYFYNRYEASARRNLQDAIANL